MTENEINQIIEQIDPDGKISQSSKEELVAALSSAGAERRDGLEASAENIEAKIKMQLGEETDWRKRAALAAKIISLNLE